MISANDGRNGLTDPQLGSIVFTTHARARRITVRIAPHGLRVTVPPAVSRAEAMRFVNSVRAKIAARQQQLRQRSPASPLVAGEGVCLRTRTFDVRVTVGTSDRLHFLLHEGTLHISCPAGADCADPELQRHMWRGLSHFLRKEALRVLPPRLKQLADEHGFVYRSVKIQPSRTRWGSCSAAGNINLSLYLMLLPPHLADYVMLHELCHTREMNHSDRFWQQLDRVTSGRAKALRDELRQVRPGFGG